ncbi:RNA-directed DNA polymerase, eukaryota, reverse transcriptase zinc-binding domain protein [Tanacetum coccineum]
MVNWIMQCVSTTAFTLNVNGDRFGYFKGGRGLRQGDPISPYLFTLIMEVFTLILHKEIDQEPNFQYHFGCKDVKLSHVCFADDLLVMCHGDAISMGVIKKALETFSAVSGLVLNNSKSTAFYGSMNKEECKAISSILPFVTGKLPVKYLGVPLIARRLGLIAAVLESIHIQNDTTKGKAKVAWTTIYKPKDQGGQGLKDLQVWNQALLSKHVWNNAGLKESLWVKWVHSVKLRGKSIWEVSIDQEDNWGWKILLSLKVTDMFDNSRWMWPNDWYRKFPMITSLNIPTISTGSDDMIVWKDFNGKIKDFSCSFSSDVWNRAQMMGDMKLNMNDWHKIIQDMSDAGNSNSIKSIIRRLLLAASVYHIWQERNNRIFKDSMKSSVDVFKGIVEVIKYKLLGITMKDRKAVIWKTNGKFLTKSTSRDPEIILPEVWLVLSKGEWKCSCLRKIPLDNVLGAILCLMMPLYYPLNHYGCRFSPLKCSGLFAAVLLVPMLSEELYCQSSHLVVLEVSTRKSRGRVMAAQKKSKECWPITKAQGNRVEVAELRMLRWTCGKTMLDMIPNGAFRAKLEVDSIIYKMREGRLRWFGHVKRRPQTTPVRRVEALVVDSLRRSGRPKLRWEDRLKQDMKELLLSEDMTSDRNA